MNMENYQIQRIIDNLNDLIDTSVEKSTNGTKQKHKKVTIVSKRKAKSRSYAEVCTQETKNL